MANDITPDGVADAFVRHYYNILSNSPQTSFKFYNESSLLSWPDSAGVLAPVTTLSAINERIMSSNFKNFSIEVSTVDAQASQDGGVIVAVAGSFTEDDQVANIFFQTFFLAKQEKGFFVLNDNLRVFGAFRSIADAAANPVTVQTSAGGNNVSDNSKSSPTEKAEDQVEKIKEALDIPAVSKDSVAKGSLSPSLVASGEKAVSAEKVPSGVDLTSNTETPPNVLSVVASASTTNSTTKISYASMVAKDAPKTATSKAAAVVPKAPLKNGVAKSSSNMSKSATGGKSVPQEAPLKNGTAKSLSNMSKSATGGKSVPQANPPPSPEARGIFVGGLPYEITEKALRDALNQFGPIKKYPDAVQIRKHEDGFCLAFVEFESADSARRAVEVHHVKFGEKQAYIAHKRSSDSRGRLRSPTRAGLRNGNGNSSGYDEGGAMGSRQSRSFGHGPRKTSRDRLN